MDQYQLQMLKKQINMAPEYLLREYYEMAILQIFSETNLTKNLIFYGGTALRLAYDSPRFSEDLDFLMIKPIKVKTFRQILQTICKQYPELSLKEIKEKFYTLFALIKITHPSLKHARHIKIEIAKRQNGISSQYRVLSSICSHFSPLIQTIDINSLEKLKIDTIMERREPRDWVDLWFIANLLKKPFMAPISFPFEPKEFKREMKRFLPQSKWLIIDAILKSCTP